MNTKLHKKAFLTNFELACEAGIVALVADLIWLVHDITNAGMSVWYAIVATGLIFGVAVTAYALARHHKYYTHRLVCKMKKIRASKQTTKESL